MYLKDILHSLRRWRHRHHNYTFNHSMFVVCTIQGPISWTEFLLVYTFQLLLYSHRVREVGWTEFKPLQLIHCSLICFVTLSCILWWNKCMHLPILHSKFSQYWVDISLVLIFINDFIFIYTAHFVTSKLNVLYLLSKVLFAVETDLWSFLWECVGNILNVFYIESSNAFFSTPKIHSEMRRSEAI